MYSQYHDARARAGALDGPTVHLTDTASLKGVYCRARESDKDVYTFKGIPYAEPPVDDLRFQRPVAKTLWKGERLAQATGNVCPQGMGLPREIYPFIPEPLGDKSEDCLVLTVHTPTLNEQANLPVIVFIHGGGYQMGSGEQVVSGVAFSTFHDVVFVAINYRLHALGFACTSDGTIPGNMGLWDQVEALKWVQTHIRKFGGNPDNVTIAGESAGAVSVSLLMLSKQAKGLFHKAVCQSGNCFMPGMFLPLDVQQQMMIESLTNLGYTGSSPKDVADFIKSRPLEELMAGDDCWRPTVDGTFFEAHPDELYKNGDFTHVPYICGTNIHEGLMVTYLITQYYMEGVEDIVTEDNARNVLTAYLGMSGHPMDDDKLNKVIEFYLKSKDDSPGRYREAAVEVAGDIGFERPAVRVMNYHADKADVYQYNFDYRPLFVDKSVYPTWAKTDHYYDVVFMMGYPFIEPLNTEYSEDDRKVSRVFMESWATFAKTGVPSYQGKAWPKYNDKKEYLLIQPEPSIKQDFKKDILDFWNAL